MRNTAKDANDFLTVDEAALLVGLSHWTIRKYIRDGALQHYRSCGRVLVRRDELCELVRPKKVEDQTQ